MAERFLTVRDVAVILGLSEKEVMDLVDSKQLDAYKVGGVYIRFKQEQIAQYRKSFKPASKHKTISSHKYLLREKISDFFYFNDFYIFSFLVIVLIVIIIFQGS